MSKRLNIASIGIGTIGLALLVGLFWNDLSPVLYWIGSVWSIRNEYQFSTWLYAGGFYFLDHLLGPLSLLFIGLLTCMLVRGKSVGKQA